MTDLRARALEWIEGDPDPATQAELQALVDQQAVDELRARLDGTLTFGTAGIRGEVGAGPNRMNRAMVIRTTAGLAHYLEATHGAVPQKPVVIGFDARPNSRQFAEDTAGVLDAAGFRVTFFPEVTPTPIVAFAAKHLDAAAAVVVTASHNPPADNGYKVYSGNGAQIIPPMDTGISAAIQGVGPANQVPRTERVFSGMSPDVMETEPEIFDAYWEAVDRSRPDPKQSDLSVVYTPMHGVGGRFLESLFERAGHKGLIPVAEQFTPDGAFPTVRFPNPEEEGALDLALKLATAEDADVVIANDPDADRLAAVVPSKSGWRPLTGNELGVLLGDYVLRHRTTGPRPIVVNSIVSSPMLAKLAHAHGGAHTVTLTGFKWIVHAGLTLEEQGVGQFVFGYEEALGYTVGSTVRDKDGLSAALVFVDLVAGLRAEGQSVLDRLEELWSVAGVWASAQQSLVRSGPEGAEAIRWAVESLAEAPPSRIGDHEVHAVTDYRRGAHERPAWLGAQALVELSLGERGRVLVRPSGTEPKLKIYVDLTERADGDTHRVQRKLTGDASSTAAALAEQLAM